MTTHSIHLHETTDGTVTPYATRYLVPLGRLLFVLIFLESVPMHFTAAGIGLAAQHGVPLASVLVPLSGVLALLGGVSVLFGVYARWGALLLALFLLPVTFSMHPFWTIGDPMQAMMQRVMFMKNVAMFGATLLLMYFGAGPISVDQSRAHHDSIPPTPRNFA